MRYSVESKNMEISDQDNPERRCHLEKAIEKYLYLLKTTGDVDQEKFVAQHPECAEELKAFLEMEGQASSGNRAARGQATPAPISPNEVRPKPDIPRLGEYELLEELGRGGMGIVYKARQRHLNRLVAVKILQSGRFASREEIDRFLGDARKAGRLQHPNIVTVHGVYKSKHFYYFSMELVEGCGLDEVVRQGALSPDDAARYLASGFWGSTVAGSPFCWSCVAGGLIQTASGSVSGMGGLFTKRSGCFA
jgi:hypothetical protein